MVILLKWTIGGAPLALAGIAILILMTGELATAEHHGSPHPDFLYPICLPSHTQSGPAPFLTQHTSQRIACDKFATTEKGYSRGFYVRAGDSTLAWISSLPKHRIPHDYCKSRLKPELWLCFGKPGTGAGYWPQESP